MPPGLRTRIDAIEPRRVSLTHAGKARIRVQGQAHGFVRCAGLTRAVWGSFDETFLVSSRGPELTIVAFGLGGSVRERIPFQADVAITPPSAPTLRHLRFAPLFVPAVKPLTDELLRAIGNIQSPLAQPTARTGATDALPAEARAKAPPPLPPGARDND